MGRRRPASRSPATIPRPSCVTKRTRTSAHGGSGSRSWADLGDGPASLIAERILADDVAGYVCFRAVCRSWRSCCDDPRKRGVLDDPRLRPRRWIMLDNDALYCRRRSFLNVSTGQCIQVDIPELVHHRVLRSTAAEGLLFLHRGSYRPVTGGIRLLNPLTRQVGELPPLGNLKDKYGHAASLASGKAGLADDRTVWIRFSGSAMAFAKPGDERWVVLDLDNDVRGYMLTPTVFFAGRFYGVTTHAIVTVDMNETNRDGGLPPRMVEAAKLDNVGIGGLYDDSAVNLLVDNNAGKLMLVHRTFHRDRTYGYRRIYKVYQVDLEAGKVTTRGDVGLAQPRRRTPCPLGVSSGVPLHRRQHRLPGPHHV